MKILRVTVQIDVIDPPEQFSETRLEDFIDDWLRRRIPEVPGGSLDWWFLQIERADPGDVEDPEWEVLR